MREVEMDKDSYLVIVVTDLNMVEDASGILSTHKPECNSSVHGVNISPSPKYGEIIHAKVNLLRSLFEEDLVDNQSIYWNTDDDYVFNPQWYAFSKFVFMNHNEIDYFSPLKEYDTRDKNKENLHGFNFVKSKSCMGGSFGTRLSSFYPVVIEFFSNYGIYNMFDQDFWKFLAGKTGKEENIYMTSDFSLVQHCNLGSHYLHTKKSKLDHMYGIGFDPLINPIKLIVE
jgi:hypothetical protein